MNKSNNKREMVKKGNKKLKQNRDRNRSRTEQIEIINRKKQKEIEVGQKQKQNRNRQRTGIEVEKKLRQKRDINNKNRKKLHDAAFQRTLFSFLNELLRLIIIRMNHRKGKELR